MMQEQPQKPPRPIGGIYHMGQTLTNNGMLTISTAYNRNTNDVVELIVIEIPPSFDLQLMHDLLQTLERRGQLSSPHVIRVRDWGIDGMHAYIALDAPHGVTLRHVIENENISLQRAFELVRQMAQGLKALHEQGIVGLDLRPQLVTVDSVAITDRVQIDDIGLRLLLRELGYQSTQIDDIGYFDPRYAAPEYFQNGPIGPWSDIYQLGLVLFEMVTGRLPFIGRNPAETGVMQSTAAIPSLRQYRHDAPSSLQHLINYALAKNPQERFLDSEFLKALDAIEIPQRARSGGRGSGESGGSGTASVTSITEPSSDESITNEMSRFDATLSATLLEHPLSSTNKVKEDVAADETLYAYLCYEKDGVEVQRFAMTKPNVIVGRTDPKRGVTPDIDLTPLDPQMTVSRKHARIRFEETFFYIEDLKSHNATRLGEVRLKEFEPQLLQDGDTVRIGAVPLVFKVMKNSKSI